MIFLSQLMGIVALLTFRIEIPILNLIRGVWATRSDVFEINETRKETEPFKLWNLASKSHVALSASSIAWLRQVCTYFCSRISTCDDWALRFLRAVSVD